MPLTEEVRLNLERTLPPAEETRKRLQKYQDNAGLTAEAMAKMIGYSVSAINSFRSDTYTHGYEKGRSRIARTDVMIRKAIEEYIARHPLDTGSTEGDGQRLYETENVAQIRHWFEHCHRNQALAFVYGPPGSQKSFVIRHLIAAFNRRELAREGSPNRAYYIYVSVGIRPRDLLRKMCAECGAPATANVQGCMASLRHHLRHTQTVFVLDEAQHAEIDALEAVRELYDAEPHIGCLLMGSHRLKQFFDTRAAELEQWNSRIDAGVELAGVSDATARAIFSAECPSLDTDQVEQILTGSRVPDPYSAKRGHTYLSMRRLFKAIQAVHAHQQSQPVESAEVLQ